MKTEEDIPLWQIALGIVFLAIMMTVFIVGLAVTVQFLLGKH